MIKRPPKSNMERLAHKLRTGKACPLDALEWLERKVGAHSNELDARALSVVKRACSHLKKTTTG